MDQIRFRLQVMYMQDWCDGVAKLAGRPGDADRKRILYEACLALEYLHLRSIVHGDFGPRSVMWFPDCIAWKLVALGELLYFLSI